MDPRALPTPEAWAPWLEAWADHLRAGGASAATVGTRLDHARRAARAMGVPPAAVTGELLVSWVGRQRWARATRRSVYASLRGLWAYLLHAGATTTDAAAGLPVVRTVTAGPRPASERAYQAALASAEPRVRVILRLAAEAGLRRAEIAQVHARDLVDDLDGWSLVVHGKGGRQRIVPLSDGLAAMVRTAASAGWALPGGCDGHLSPRYVGVLATRALPAGVTLHQLRHRFATRAYEGSRDLLAVQHLLGHASPATTQTYVLSPRGAMRRAAAAAA